MAEVQKENGYTSIANELVEALARVNLTAYQQRILWVIWRKTYGWQGKKADYISISQFEKLTGIDRRNIVRTVRELEMMQMITVERDSTRTAKFAFQKDYEKWKLLSNRTIAGKKKLLSNESKTIVLSDNKTIVLSDTHKTKTIYKTNKGVSDLLEKFTGEEKNLIDQLLEAVASTRKTGKIADSVKTSILQHLQKYPRQQVIAGCRTYLDKQYHLEGKSEKYLYGIIRNTPIVGGQLIVPRDLVPSGSRLLDDYYNKRFEEQQGIANDNN